MRLTVPAVLRISDADVGAWLDVDARLVKARRRELGPFGVSLCRWCWALSLERLVTRHSSLFISQNGRAVSYSYRERE
jgi:hypothetical protein